MIKVVAGLSVVMVVVAAGSFLWRTDSATEVPQEPTSAPEVVATSTDSQPPAPIVLEERSVRLPNGSEATFRMPKEFEIAVAAEDLGKVRFMALSPDGRLFVPDIVDYKLSHEGQLFVLGDFNTETKRFETKHTYLSGLRGPNSVAFYTDENGKHWLYLALTAHLVRYPYRPGDLEPSGEPEIVIEFPNEQSPGEESVVWHITRTIFFHEGRIYASVGSGCNSCEQLAGDMRAMVYSMKPDGSDKRIEGDGLRNTVGIAIAEGELYATANGADHLGTDRPHEGLYKVEGGTHYGWPFCYIFEGEMIPDPSQEWDEPIPCDTLPTPLAWFEPRSAPLGLRFFENEAHSVLRNSFLIALHGSFEPWVGTGYEIRRMTLDGNHEVFMDGFLRGEEQLARPVDFLQRDTNSFFFTDDHAGRIYYVYARQENAAR